MSFRQLVITSKSHLSIQDTKIKVTQDNHENLIPIEDLTIIVIDGSEITMSANFMASCAKKHVTIMICGENHIPASLSTSINQHYRPFQVIEYQINQTKMSKNKLTDLLLKRKIVNQCKVVELVKMDKSAMELLNGYVKEVYEGDILNREATAAKVFFNSLYGADYIRFEDDILNKAQNYGYGVLRSSIARNLNALGLCSYIGINHHGKTNPYNLVYDIIEPFRPIVDYYVYQNKHLFTEELTTQVRKELVNLLNAYVVVDDKYVSVQYAIELLCKSFLKAIEEDKLFLSLPELIQINFDKLNEPI